jgi:predicted MFS family arabinose efflux permease
MEKNKKLLLSLMVTYFAHYFSFNLWHTTFNNFAVELFRVDGQQIGIIQSLREIPGFLGFTLGFISLFLSETNVAALSTILLGAGLIATGLSSSYLTLIWASILMSIGFHYYYTVNSSLVLMVSEKRAVAHTVGKFRSVGSLSAIAAMISIYFLVERVGYRNLYYFAGGIAILFGAYLFTQRSRASHISPLRRIIFRRRYWLYYVLSFLEGSKKHISSTFAVFLLVSVFGISAKNVSLLFLINSIITSYTHQRLGRYIDRIGEKVVLSVYYSVLCGIYLIYGLVKNVWVIAVVFVVSNVAMGLSMALNSYFQKIAPPDEITSNVSMRTTIDHIAAIFIPLIGGIIWSRFGYLYTFLMGTAIVFSALFVTQFLKPRLVPKEGQT